MKNLFLIAATLLASCTLTNKEESSLESIEFKEGPWLVTLDIGEQDLPFNLTHKIVSGTSVLTIENGKEQIEITEIHKDSDSIVFTVPVFGTVFNGQFISDSVIEGLWNNPTRGKDYLIPFKAEWGKSNRFASASSSNNKIFEGRWEVKFGSDKDDYCKAVGLFSQNGNQVTGTFLTETGDYRFLEGEVCDNTMWLSCFDGSHAFLFSAEQNENGELNGQFWSGSHWQEPWIGIRNENYEIAHPDSLTTIVNEINTRDLEFMGLDGELISLSDSNFDNKVIIIQILGSWCPNCADETRDFAQLYNMYHDKGLEILAVAYEAEAPKDVTIERIEKFKSDLGAKYHFALGDGECKKDASKQFPFLSGILSFPTAIFIDPVGKIRKIHTGYYGPGTGEYYLKYKEACEMFVEKLLRERSTTDLVDPLAVSSSFE